LTLSAVPARSRRWARIAGSTRSRLGPGWRRHRSVDTACSLPRVVGFHQGAPGRQVNGRPGGLSVGAARLAWPTTLGVAL
jgi:hypothetical protein